MEIAVRAHLIADPAVSALVGTRIYPEIMPQGVQYPAVRYQLIDTPRTYAKGGYAGMSRPRLQIDCWSPSYLEAKRLAAAIRAAMERYPYAVCENEADMSEGNVEPPLYRRMLEFRIWHEEE